MTTSCFDEIVEKDLDKGVHISGVGGVGMTAIAELLIDRGVDVTGSDIIYSKNIERLQRCGIKIYLNQQKSNVGERLVCRSRAIKDSNEEVVYAKKSVYRSSLLSFLAQEKKQIVITGSHGKTTTTALLSHCMKKAGYDISYAVGGFCSNLGSYGKIGSSEYFIIEGDESDGSHLKTNPYGGILTSCDVDHLAFWKKGDHLHQSYKTFANNIRHSNHFLFNEDDLVIKNMKLEGVGYGLTSEHGYRPSDISLTKHGSTFNIKGQIFTLPMFGEYNIKNAVAVYGFLTSIGVSEEKIQEGFSTFKGILRRMEYLGRNIYSDYAHHPAEILEVLEGVKSTFKEVKIIFEPHRLSRFRDEIEYFCKVFDEIVITDIFEAHEGLDIDGVSLIKKFCEDTNSIYIPIEKIGDFIENEEKTILALGAGPLDGKLREYLGIV